MSTPVEFVLSLKDRMSSALDRATDKSDRTRKSLDNLKKSEDGLDRGSKKASKSVKQLKDELTKLHRMKDLLPAGSEEKLKRVNKQIQDVERNIKRTHSTGRSEASRNKTISRSSGGGLGFLANPLALLGAASVGAAAYGIREGAQRDYQRRQFTNSYGSAGGAFHRQLNKNRGSLGDSVFENGKTLADSGYDIGGITGLLGKLGDVSNGDEGKLGSLTSVFAKMRKEGKFTTDMLDDLNKEGFKPLQIIAKTTGENFDSLFDRMRDGTISINEITGALDTATSAGGAFFGNMDRLADSPLSKMEKLGDTVKDMASNFGENILGIGESIADFFQKNIFDPIENLDKDSYWGKVFDNFDKIDKAIVGFRPSDLVKEDFGKNEKSKAITDQMDLNLGDMDLAGDFLRDLKKNEVNRRDAEKDDKKKDRERINSINGGGQRVYNITVGKLIETMNNTFQGTVKENAAQINQIISEELVKLLASSAGR